jgi:quinol monooxygenase YgiN
MLVVHVHVHVRPERVEDFLAATLVNARASLAEPGVVRFDVIQGDADPAHVILTEASAMKASSTQGNPIVLAENDLRAILAGAA